jgi:hypothetical protein
MCAMTAKSKNKISTETRNSSAFLHSVEVFTKKRANEKFFRAAPRGRSPRRSSAGAGRGAYTQN